MQSELHSLLKDMRDAVGIIKWLLGDHSGSWVSFLTHQTLEVATSYQQAKHMLTNTVVVAPVYFILGGTIPSEVNYFLYMAGVWSLSFPESGFWSVLESFFSTYYFLIVH